MKPFQKLKPCWGLLLGAWLLASCTGVKYLQENECLLYSQSIKGASQVPVEELEAYYRQRPNRKLLFFAFSPYVVAYFEGKKPYERKLAQKQAQLAARQAYYDQILEDTTLTLRKERKITARRDRELGKLRRWIEEGNWLMRVVGEKPVFFDSIQMYRTAQQMQLAIRQRGFFSARVQPTYRIKNQLATVTYHVHEGTPHLINQLSYASKDTALLQLVLKDTLNSLVRPGMRYDEGVFAQERDRITRYLRNNGYFEFTRDFIFFDIDTAVGKPHRLDVRITIETLPPFHKHRQFTIGEVEIITDINVESQQPARDTLTYKGLRIVSFDPERYSPKLLEDRIRLKPFRLISQVDAEETQRALAALDMFKFVNIVQDTAGTTLRPRILVSPLPANELNLEGGLNVAQALPGPFFSIAWRNRNIFRGCEIAEFRARGSLEAQGSAAELQNTYNAQELSLHAAISFPKLIFPISMDKKRALQILSPKTRFTTGYTFIRRPEYDRLNFQSSFNYEWTNLRDKQFTLTPFDLTIVNTPRYQDSFIEYLLELAAGGNTLLRSFSRLLISSFSANFVYSTPNRRNAVYIKLFGESGGTTLNLLSDNFLRTNSTLFGLEYFRFVKFNSEARYYLPLGKEGTLALRANVGIAYPYGKTEDARSSVLPYEKYFFTGGSNSIRAWRPRRLGPGSYTPPFNPQTGLFDLRFEQPGEVLLEMNAELRSKLFGFVHGALFVDAGNVWMLTPDTRPGADFRFYRFMKEIAVGTGLGLRMDFSIVILRFDVGLRVWDPAFPLQQRFVLGREAFRNPTFNVGIGYPF
ncbi:MAG: BamA/TamA family outer membrane protein [Cytophagales bacterium]|nr:BamA/TamA family outer membrane protein [Bernardetiaceae bacterium]MDW8210186.1 BamA/TamA family outer membrane protein [Cytophagales bacterium]